MMDMDATPVQSRLDPARVAEAATPFSLSGPDRASADARNAHQDTDAVQRIPVDAPSLYRNDGAAPIRAQRPAANSSARDAASTGLANVPQTTGHAASLRNEHDNISNALHAQPVLKHQHLPPGSNNSQETNTTTNESDRIFTPPVSEGGLSNGLGNGHDSSQESQLLQLSQLVAAQEKMPVSDAHMSGLSRKRMADGFVKHTRERSSASPVFSGGHSRNTSTVSMASTAGSRIGELSAELKTRLSYAMVKVNHGWHGHSIDQVESLASQAASPTSSNSTIHFGHGSSASPQLSNSSHLASNPGPATSGISQHSTGRPLEPAWRDSPHMRTHDPPASPLHPAPSLAPPVSIQPSRRLQNPRRNSNAKTAPSLISVPQHASPNTTPHTPGQPSPYIASHHRTPIADPILFSPHQTPHQAVREQDAMEALLFMSSPGNSANLKHSFPPSSHPTASRTTGSQRTALPGSQPRKSLPTGRPAHLPQSHSQPTPKRVGFERSFGNFGGDMDVDTDPPPFGTPHHARTSNSTSNTPRRKANGGEQPRAKQFPLSAGLTAPLSSRPPRPPLADADIDRMLDRAAAAADNSSDSEGEIQIPQRGGAHAVGA